MSQLDRRTLLRRGLQGAGLVMAAPLLAACGDSDDAKGAGGGSGHGSLGIRLAWIKNVEFAGEYLADANGHYRAEGFSKVDLITGGPNATPAETDVVTGKAFAGLSSPDRVGAAVLQGAPLKIIGSQYQKNPFAITSMAKNPIKTPQDMIGKKIGVQATNEAVWNAFLKAAKIDPKQVTKVPVQFDPLPLTTGTVDGWMSYVTNEPNVLKLKGFDTHVMLLADNSYPLVGESYLVTTEAIEKNRDKIKAMLRAEIKGWKDSLKDPAAGAELAVDTYGKGLGLEVKEQTLESTSQNALILTADTKKNGIFTMTPELVQANISTLKFAGVDISAEQLFDLSILEEVYKEDPSLV
ncbi:ABC transporter substrate-binding protein [Actinomadura parmotrematis]|uniref:Thiamine pyrimidine synthase n=1 Tax=Actinomadura parmotrematis TaxID=2864039 RepID=A0ABS7G0D4_9ACTN|nr:ABC transporter substrate-binding protein [Actinomadura parmotrematis]MBW8485655.1 ABC transporter substrate-binding protein [Actinomadura parmotrematis]